MALHLHRSERADALVGPLAALLAQPLQDPFTADVLAVPTKGIERWLAQRLSHHLGATDGEAGVCANVTFPSPSRLVGDVLGHVLGLGADDDPWQPDRLVWPLLDVIDGSVAEPWCAVLGRHLGADDADGSHRHTRRYPVARHLAHLFTSYATQRPSMLLTWADGDATDGAGSEVPEDLAWQPHLWQRLRDRVGVPSPAERLHDALARLRDEPQGVDLPARLSVFGPTRLPEDQLQVLAALAEHRDVHLWLLQASATLWDVAGPAASPRRRDRVILAKHPLLASLGKDSGELRQRLLALDAVGTDTHHPAPAPPPTLLGALQQQLRDDEPPDTQATIDPGDRSVQVHACHGRARQVEVLRERLLHLFAADETLEPRDVLVMCPDIEDFAPLVTATFGLAPDAGDGTAGERTHDDVHPGHRLRVRLADRSVQQTNPLLAVLARLLGMADGRVTASELLDLAASEPVRRRFGFDDEDLDRIRDWAVNAGTRWGEDVERRARFGLDRVGQGTWEATLDRILLGAAMADEDERWIGTALPLDDVDSTDLDLAGRLAELVDRLRLVLRRLDGEHPLPHWLDALDRALDLLADTRPSDPWQSVQARRVLASVRESAEAQGSSNLRLPEVRALLAGRLEGRPTRASFRTGHLTMCSMVPMRSVPHRVICLLGLDDGTFPRGSAQDGDDVLLRDPLVGERERRSEDRQLFLDAVLAAGDHLVIVYSGADERTGAERAPAVPVGELLDALDRTAVTPDGSPAREHVVVRHPLQPFDARNYVPGLLGVPGPASFDSAAYRGALAARAQRVPEPPFLSGPLRVPEQEELIELEDLIRFLEHPVRAFLRHRIGVVQTSGEDDVDDRLPLEVAGLDAWNIGDRLLTARLKGVEVASARGAEWRRGQLPPGALGGTVLAEIGSHVEPIVAEATRVAGDVGSVDVNVDLPDGRAVTGTMQVRDGVLLRASYSNLAAKHRLRAWVQLLALASGRPGTQWTAVTVGKGPGKRPTARRSVLTAPTADDARLWLEQLVDLRDRGLREPLPLPVKTSAAYAAGRLGGATVEQCVEDARSEWDAGRFGFGEAGDIDHALVWGAGAPLTALLVQPPTREELTWWLDESTRFGALARRVWQPLLEHERLETP